MHRRAFAAVLTTASVVLTTSAGAASATHETATHETATHETATHETGIHDNCTKFNQRYPHGVGTKKAVDKTSGTKVTTFKRDNDIYWLAEKHNSDLDRDNDRIACEKA